MHATQKLLPKQRVNPADTLRYAALYLAWAGWIQNDLYPDTTEILPPADVVGALAMAVYGQRVDTPHCGTLAADLIRAEDVLRDYLRTQALDLFPITDGLAGLDYRDTDDLHDLYSWNDAPWQTTKNVIDTLNAAAEDYDRPIGGAA